MLYDFHIFHEMLKNDEFYERWGMLLRLFIEENKKETHFEQEVGNSYYAPHKN